MIRIYILASAQVLGIDNISYSSFRPPIFRTIHTRNRHGDAEDQLLPIHLTLQDQQRIRLSNFWDPPASRFPENEHILVRIFHIFSG